MKVAVAILVCVAASGCISIPGPTATTAPPPDLGLDGNWAMFHGSSKLLGASEPFQAEGLGNHSSRRMSGGVAAPAIVGNASYLAFQGMAARFDLDRGATVWTYDIDISVPISVRNSDAVVAGDSRLVLLNAESGTSRWESALSGIDGQPALDSERVYVPSRGITAFDLRNGHPAWNKTFGVYTSPPILSGGNLFISWAADDGARVGVYKTNDGAKVWERKVDQGTYASAPAVTANMVLVSVNNGLVALDLKDGSERWRREVGTMPSPPGVLPTIAVVIDNQNRVSAFDLSTGKDAWAFYIGSAPCGAMNGACAPRQATLCANAETIVIPAWDGFLHVLDAQTGDSLRKETLESSTNQCAWSGEYLLLQSPAGIRSYPGVG